MYIHNESTHNITDPEIIVDELLKIIHPSSVIDIGCGIGTFLNIFRERGCQETIGVDGAWVDRTLLAKYISVDNFFPRDISDKFLLGKTFDLAICLEVAEHIRQDRSDILVENIVNHSKCVLFSAALPYQQGQNHINEQPLSYWKGKFESHGYKMVDNFRGLIWNEKRVKYWYKQNSVWFVHPDSVWFDQINNFVAPPIIDIVHPETLMFKVVDLEKIYNSDRGYSFYLKLLFKKLIKIFKVS